MDSPKVLVRIGEPVLFLQGELKILQCLRQIVLFAINDAEVIEYLPLAGLQIDGTLVIGYGTLLVSSAGIGQATLTKSVSVLGVNLQGLVVFADRHIQRL